MNVSIDGGRRVLYSRPWKSIVNSNGESVNAGDFLRARATSIQNAFRGIGVLLATQSNARVHLGCTAIVLLAAWACDLLLIEWVMIVLAIGGVWAAEGMNTAIEFTVDLVSPEHNELAGKAKDVAAGAVLIVSLTAIVVGLCVFVPYALRFMLV